MPACCPIAYSRRNACAVVCVGLWDPADGARARDQVVVLEASVETVNERIANRRVDRTTDRVYSVKDEASDALVPEDRVVLSRLKVHRR